MEKRGLLLTIVILIFVAGVLVGGWAVWKYTGNPGDKTNTGVELIGGCAGVSLENFGECCDNWAEENEVVHIACVGKWVIEDNVCAWECDAGELTQ